LSERSMSIVFSSGISSLTERNSSFDSGVLRVCYTGRNRNNSFISKETFERCMPSIYNCPIVCRYDRDTDTIGSHDMELVETDDGGICNAHLVHIHCLPSTLSAVRHRTLCSTPSSIRIGAHIAIKK